jgi:hypothetical protein
MGSEYRYLAKMNDPWYKNATLQLDKSPIFRWISAGYPNNLPGCYVFLALSRSGISLALRNFFHKTEK